MRKNIVGAVIASAFAASGAAHAGLLLDLNGSGAGGLVQADALDWAPTSFLARGGITAISNFRSGSCGSSGAGCQFDVMTHAVLTTYTETGTGAVKNAQAFGQITMVAKYTEQVINYSPATSLDPTTTAKFASTGIGSVEFYYTPAANANDLTGFGFNSGRLIGRLTGVDVGKIGSFTVDGGPVLLDGTSDGNQYGTQQTVTGSGSQAALNAGLGSKDLDGTFFLSTLTGFKLNFENISIGLPYSSVNPSDCFNDPLAGRTVGTNGYTSTCDNVHQLAAYSGQVNGTGYTPNTGPVNGFDSGFTDFIAQTDFNSSVNGVPEPGSLALTGLALAAAGMIAKRRRNI